MEHHPTHAEIFNHQAAHMQKEDKGRAGMEESHLEQQAMMTWSHHHREEIATGVMVAQWRGPGRGEALQPATRG
jgi:hypothetical protein